MQFKIQLMLVKICLEPPLKPLRMFSLNENNKSQLGKMVGKKS